MSQTKSQLIGGLGISTAQSLVVGAAVTINSSGINAGIITASSFSGDGSGLTGVGIGSTGNINTTGIITASSFRGKAQVV